MWVCEHIKVLVQGVRKEGSQPRRGSPPLLAVCEKCKKRIEKDKGKEGATGIDAAQAHKPARHQPTPPKQNIY
jgi:hypothetical protein